MFVNFFLFVFFRDSLVYVFLKSFKLVINNSLESFLIYLGVYGVFTKERDYFFDFEFRFLNV